MKWKGKEYKTYPEIIKKALSLNGDNQEKFVEKYAKSGPYALQNVGYFSGYYDSDMMAQIQSIFKTAHPVFGRRIPNAKEALTAGKMLGKNAKHKL